MNCTAVCLASLFLVGILRAQQTVGQEPAATPNALQSIERFNNRQMTLLKNGKPTMVHITIRDWLIHGQQKIDKFPETGMLVVYLNSGNVTTRIGGKEEKRQPGEYWSVPAGTAMAVEVTSESAGLHIVAIGAP